MIYFATKGNSLEVLTQPSKINDMEFRGFVVWSAHDYQSFEEAESMAKKATKATGIVYIPVDHGPGHKPRFDVIMAPQVGDRVSRGFNGDYYPEGEIVKVSKTYAQIKTSTGTKFYRSKQSAKWKNGTFVMCRGHRDERNPHI